MDSITDPVHWKDSRPVLGITGFSMDISSICAISFDERKGVVSFSKHLNHFSWMPNVHRQDSKEHWASIKNINKPLMVVDVLGSWTAFWGRKLDKPIDDSILAKVC